MLATTLAPSMSTLQLPSTPARRKAAGRLKALRRDDADQHRGENEAAHNALYQTLGTAPTARSRRRTTSSQSGLRNSANEQLCKIDE
ncbi:hypothetical protein J2797_006641 [Paraburkholderia terricola]|uniref:hypothetical protein n=1 Tax=Paraburkholderia terricola TaxID=169427 RepID=UPI00286704D2|nr:hypothetical protein [Paraburkholderia terricola]MDR6496714.1 hypothetical protein [Paraburkholderia terricola]